jgi:hypothetical protein
MSNESLSICVVFFWYGLSLVLYTFIFIRRVGGRYRATATVGAKPPILLVRLFLFLVGLVGVLGLALLLGIYNGKVDYINQSMILGGLLGIPIAKLLISPP